MYILNCPCGNKFKANEWQEHRFTVRHMQWLGWRLTKTNVYIGLV